MTRLEKSSPCKVNLLLNILGKRPDGFHELETVMHPVGLTDELRLERTPGRGVELTCSRPDLPTDSTNLVWRAAAAFFKASGISEGVRIHLDKRIPLAAGLGGGSGNAAVTLLGLNELFDMPLGSEVLTELAAGLGSDVPFFLQPMPALATGRGEKVQALAPFPALEGVWLLLLHPGFGVSTAWAYQALARFPDSLNGRPGRAKDLLTHLQSGHLRESSVELYNSLEAPVLEKYPVLALYQEFLRENGALAALMSGSGSTTFALFASEGSARKVVDPFRARFGSSGWLAVVPMSASSSSSSGSASYSASASS